MAGEGGERALSERGGLIINRADWLTMIAPSLGTSSANRLRAKERRGADARGWQVAPRAHAPSIELGGLVVKAGLVELADDDRAVLLGVIRAAAELRARSASALTLWRRRGQGLSRRIATGTE
jgi:hypothetical protein